jgi:hypothetical protein
MPSDLIRLSLRDLGATAQPHGPTELAVPILPLDHG